MQRDRPSLTATAVALARGDRLALPYVPAPVRAALAAVERRERVRGALGPVARLATLGMIDHIELRTAAIDAALREALARGVDQLVLLGAGLDGRAWRMPELAASVVFEIDHPATQRAKRGWLEAARPAAREVRLVSVDFERESIAARLRELGHDPARRTAWIWEGVTMYLTRPATLATLREVGAASAPGSVLLVTYLEPGLVPLPALRGVAALFFAALSEPMLGTIGRDELAAATAAAGFAVRADTDNAAWAAAAGRSARRAWLFRAERLAACERL